MPTQFHEHRTKLAEKPSTRHPGCNVVLYQLEWDYVTWIETTDEILSYPAGYVAWGHYFERRADALADFNKRS